MPNREFAPSEFYPHKKMLLCYEKKELRFLSKSFLSQI